MEMNTCSGKTHTPYIAGDEETNSCAAWTVEESCKLESMIKEGADWKTISRVLQRSEGSCRSRWKRMSRGRDAVKNGNAKRTCSYCGAKKLGHVCGDYIVLKLLRNETPLPPSPIYDTMSSSPLPCEPREPPASVAPALAAHQPTTLSEHESEFSAVEERKLLDTDSPIHGSLFDVTFDHLGGEPESAEPAKQWERVWQCKYPGCTHRYAYTNGVRKHARIKHNDWLQRVLAQTPVHGESKTTAYAELLSEGTPPPAPEGKREQKEALPFFEFKEESQSSFDKVVSPSSFEPDNFDEEVLTYGLSTNSMLPTLQYSLLEDWTAELSNIGVQVV